MTNICGRGYIDLIYYNIESQCHLVTIGITTIYLYQSCIGLDIKHPKHFSQSNQDFPP